MTKHEKVTRFSWDVPEHEFAEAKVKKLEAENKKLKDTVKALERELARKGAEIELLRAKIVKLVAHYV